MSINKPLALVHIELFKREFLPKLYLALKLAKKYDFQILIGKVENYAQKKKGTGVYLNKDHGLWSRERLLKIQENGYLVTAFDEEGMIYKSDELYNQTRGDKELLERLDAVFLWGNKQLETIRKNNPARNNKYLTGSPKFDLYRKLKDRTNETSNESELVKVLINTRFTYVNPLSDSLEKEIDNLRRLNFITTPREEVEFQEFVESDKKIFLEFVKLIKSLANNDRFRITIRPHPAEKIDVYRELAGDFKNVTVDYSTELAQQICENDCVIHDGCTTAIEARALGKHVFGLRPDGLKSPYLSFANQFSTNFQECKPLIEHLHNRNNWQFEDVTDIARKYIANWSDSTATDSIAKVMNSFNTAPNPLLKHIAFKERVKYSFKRMLFHLIHKTFWIHGKLPSKIKNRLDSFYKSENKSLATFPPIYMTDVKRNIQNLCSLDNSLGSESDYVIKKVSAHSFLIYK
ncbi:hypothetical protein NJR55_02990 [Idiomarina sp. M1R2S28]|uniref:Surface carbohydrate biosynthesis protein n=1 Tax=Idiomarina rhizosphaerae TaxID=2961572 RepID=A0A9X2JR79_9GAMM|nr:surface carbohydrate biosynthesis protein [Idiomarina rhizosphaerae]MCP1338548.1 hypothetical protein [Idiomarina rhizosphaerae]